MKLSLRSKLFVMVLAINAAVFAAGSWYLLGRIEAEGTRRTQQLADEVVFTVASTIRPGEQLNAARILAWPSWSAIEDALLVDDQLLDLGGGRVRPLGLALNPVGALHRPSSFDTAGVLSAIERALRTGRPVDGIEGGRAVPILLAAADARFEAPDAGPGAGGRVWGGCWYRVRGGASYAELMRDLVPWLILSTLLLSGGTYLMLRELVLRPVEGMAATAQRIERGDLGARAAEGVGAEEVAALVRSFNSMTARVEGFQRELVAEAERAAEQARRAEAAAMTQRRLAAMGELAAGIAHEINNPLGGLINAAEALERAELPPAKRAQYLALIQDGLERIRLIVSQLLRFTPRAAAQQDVLLSEVVRDALALVRHRAERLQVELVFAPPAGELPVRGLRNELGQALLNLLGNALDALESAQRAGGRVQLTLEPRPAEIVLAVQDNGPGMASELVPRAADLFFSTKAVGQGTGIGLSIVHDIARKHGGRLTLSSAPGQGFRAELALPRAAQEPA